MCIRDRYLPVSNYLDCAQTELEATLSQRLLDAVHLVSNDYIRFVQCTAGATHTYYLDVIHSLLMKLGTGHCIYWKNIDFMILRPEDDRRDFEFYRAPGSLVGHGYVRFDGQLWDRSNGKRNNVSFCQLPWTE